MVRSPRLNGSDLTADKAVRVTGKDDYVWEPFWLSANEFLCIMQKENEKQASIYRMSLDGKNPKLLVKHARTAERERTVQIYCSHRPVAGYRIHFRRKPGRPTGPWLLCYLSSERSRAFASASLILLVSFPAPCALFRTSAAFSAYNRRNLLNQFVRLKLSSQR